MTTDERSNAILRIRGLGKRYGPRWVLRDLDLALAPGELVALLGESGAGKSTLLNLIAGLESPDEGEIALAGNAMHALDADASARVRRRTLGFVFQAFHLIAHLSVAHNVAIPLLLNGIDQAEALRRASAMLGRLGLGDRGASPPAELSGGEQQRVALARALVHQPAVLLADEPTGNLDPATADVALGLLAEQVRERGAALLMVTHSEHAAAIADHRYRLGPEGLARA
jgi:putative ABC transport system ATP-binding protein